MDNGDLICEAVIDLEPGDKTSIEEKMLFCETDRNSKINSLILHAVAFLKMIIL